MRPLSFLFAFALAFLASARPAAACDPAEYWTHFDLLDLSDRVAVAEVTRIDRKAGQGTSVTLSVEDTLRGTSAATITVTDPGGTCSPGFSVGQRGIIFADSAGNAVGLYDSFLTDHVDLWAGALRSYAAGDPSGLVDMAVSKDWSRSFEASMTLADRVDLLVGLDAAAKDRIVARLRKVQKDHPLLRVAARLHDARVAAIVKKRRMGATEDGLALRSVLADRYEAETDPAVLADVIEAGSTKRRDRVAALERCERLRGKQLARFMSYLVEGDASAWKTRADACRATP